MEISEKKKIISILHTEWSKGLGGQEIRILSEADSLARRGHRIQMSLNAEAVAANHSIEDYVKKTGVFYRQIHKVKSRFNENIFA